MACHLCGKNNPTIYFKGLVDGETTKLLLCEPCAKNKVLLPLSPANPATPILNRGTLQPVGTACPLCGLTLAEFKHGGQLGCSQCYSTYAGLIGPVLKRLHGSNQHVGKRYARAIRTRPLDQELAGLKLDLREAVAGERFEEAATLRDQIRSVEDQIRDRSRMKRP